MLRSNPPAHYQIPGTDLELIDVIKSKLSPAEWQAFCWASLIQYAYRCLTKGEAIKDIGKMTTYGAWLAESVAEHGVLAGAK